MSHRELHRQTGQIDVLLNGVLKQRGAERRNTDPQSESTAQLMGVMVAPRSLGHQGWAYTLITL